MKDFIKYAIQIHQNHTTNDCIDVGTSILFEES